VKGTNYEVLHYTIFYILFLISVLYVNSSQYLVLKTALIHAVSR